MPDLQMTLPLQLTDAIGRLAGYARMDTHVMAADLVLCGLDRYETLLTTEKPDHVAHIFEQCARPMSTGAMVSYSLPLADPVWQRMQALAQATSQPPEQLAHRAMAYAYHDWTKPFAP